MKISARVGSRIHDITVDRQDGLYVVQVDGQRHEVDVRKLEADFYTILMEGRSYEVSVEADRDVYHVRHGAAEQQVVLTDPSRRARAEMSAAGKGPQEIGAVMPGRVVRVLVNEGDAVQAGGGLVVIEAMKMENEIASPRPGTVREVKVEAGQAVEAGAVLVIID